MLKQFKVACDECPFESDVEARDRAEAIAREHHTETGHDIVALEVPRKRNAG